MKQKPYSVMGLKAMRFWQAAILSSRVGSFILRPTLAIYSSLMFPRSASGGSNTKMPSCRGSLTLCSSSGAEGFLICTKVLGEGGLTKGINGLREGDGSSDNSSTTSALGLKGPGVGGHTARTGSTT